MKIAVCVLLAALICGALARVSSGSYRYEQNRLNPVPGRRVPFARRRPFSGLLGGRSRSPLRRRIKVVRQSEGSEESNSVIGPASALRAGQEGSYDFSDQYNAITPDKKYNKPVKPNRPAVSTANNRINIESKVTSATQDDDITIEKVHIGDTAIVHCTFDDVDQIGAFTQAKIWWTKLSDRAEDRPVIMAAGTQVRLPDDRLRVVTFPDNSFSILIIKDVLPEDAGQYKCSLPTVSGTSTAFTRLQVEEAPSDTVSVSPKETSLKSGDTLNLFCKPQNPNVNVWWTAKDADANNIDVTRGFDRVAGRTLTIQNIQHNQAGVYTCHVEEGIGSPIRRHFTVSVEERPWEIEAYIGGFRVNSLLASYSKDPVFGDDVNLRCDSGGVPTPSITWFKDGRQISNSYKYSINSYEPSYKLDSVVSKLTISNFQQYDEGIYSCKAVNEAGTQSQEFDIEGAEEQEAPLQTDDEDVNRSALRGRRGQLRVVVCKGGQPCRTQGASNSASQSAYYVRGGEGSGDDE